jgi:hypothetical protein
MVQGPILVGVRPFSERLTSPTTDRSWAECGPTPTSVPPGPVRVAQKTTLYCHPCRRPVFTGAGGPRSANVLALAVV